MNPPDLSMNMQESLGAEKIWPVVVFPLESLPYSHFYPPTLEDVFPNSWKKKKT